MQKSLPRRHEFAFAKLVLLKIQTQRYPGKVILRGQIFRSGMLRREMSSHREVLP
jgi:hypothetical protein